MLHFSHVTLSILTCKAPSAVSVLDKANFKVSWTNLMDYSVLTIQTTAQVIETGPGFSWSMQTVYYDKSVPQNCLEPRA